MAQQLDELTAISPIDGRYFDVTSPLRNYFSEYAYFRTNLEIELRYFVFLSDKKIIRRLTKKEKVYIKNIYTKFTVDENRSLKKQGAADGLRIHDVKSIEYYIRKKFASTSLSGLTQWIHFGLTSNDIADNAYRLMVTRALSEILRPKIATVTAVIDQIAKTYARTPMLGRTHGQAAVPTTFGKEIAVFSSRLRGQIAELSRIQMYGKFGGAIGNWNALSFIYPNKDWTKLSGKFLKSIGLEHSLVTTQIAPPEDLIQLFQCMQRINSIILDLDGDMWRYISDNWVVQKEKTAMVGSSAMPQKVNPLEFENSEGNLIVANGIFDILCHKLPVSRLQRDLSGSTVMRNIGVALAHSLLAYESCLVGLRSIDVNKEEMINSLNKDWSVLSEALQTVLRKNNISGAYEIVAKQFRGKKVTQAEWVDTITSLDIPAADKQELLELTPQLYIGLSESLARLALKKT